MRSILRKLLGREQGPPKMLEPGTAAPEFSVKAHDGTTVALSALRGKKIVLWFFPKADTPGCTIEGNSFRDRYDQFTARGARILGCSFDDAADNKAFAEKFGYPFPLLCDTTRTVGLAYGACDSASARNARRITYVIDEHGRIAHALPKVDPTTHIAQVLSLL
ncbi:MAG TPA: peroxiredoxin [Candidatus Limnocylindrales bacterium]|nr:peroxiredoxin [Candidatus Limnocylindrales bacterium]